MKLLIYSPDSFSLFYPNTSYIFGGVEVEASHIAHEFANTLNTETVVVTINQGKKTGFVGKILVVPSNDFKGEGFYKTKKSFLGKLKSRVASDPSDQTDQTLLETINPDVVFAQGISPGIETLITYCKKHKKKFIFRIASDMELGGTSFDPEYFKNTFHKTVDEMKRVFASATEVVTQSNQQQAWLLQRFGIQSCVINNPIDLENFAKAEPKIYDAIWIGKSMPVKRPELFIALAKATLTRKFLMVLNKLDHSLWKTIVESLPKNIELIESLGYSEIDTYFAKSKLLVNTSSIEGFPNTFLQAAKYGVPIVSMCIDPNGMITSHKAGVLSGDSIAQLGFEFENLLENKTVYEHTSKAARSYVSRYHDRRTIGKAYFDLIKNT